MILLSSSSFAELYKCTTPAKISYQDKPCKNVQNQTVMHQKTHKIDFQTVKFNQSAIIERDAQGKIKRSKKAKNEFKALNPCPATQKYSEFCPDYVIDHINPLACGGADSPENMQWQTVSDGKLKDKWERHDCASQVISQFSSTIFLRQINTAIVKNSPKTVYTGKRGGRYIFTKQGKKRYLKSRLH